MKKVGFLLAEDFEEADMQQPYEAIARAGYEVVVIGADKGEPLFGKSGRIVYTADISIGEADAGRFDALVIPGGLSAERLRLNGAALRFVSALDRLGKPICAIGRAPQILISAGVASGRTMTCLPALRDDLVNAGAHYADRETAVDGHVITSRSSTGIPAFIREMLKRLETPAAQSGA